MAESKPLARRREHFRERRLSVLIQLVEAYPLYKWFMGAANILQTAARKYCIDQHALWTARYAAFPFRGGPYTEVACDVFPRYRLASETLINIERVAFSNTTPLEEARGILLNAGADALYVLKEQLEQLEEGKAAVLALEDQLSVYRKFIASFDPLTGQTFDLPFRRVLLDEEVAGLWQTLQGRWGICGAGYGWFPLSKDAQPVGSLTFHTDLWEARKGDALFQRFLTSTGVSRCFLLRELGPPDYELDRELANPAYDGSEVFLFTTGDWVVYASHESSLTLAGSVAAFFREQWGDADTLAYGGPFKTSDLRGRWK